MSRREEELAKIAALRNRLEGLKAKTAPTEAKSDKKELEELVAQCKSLLSNAEDLIVEVETAQEVYAEEDAVMEEEKDVLRSENEELKKEVEKLRQQAAESKAEDKKEGEKAVEEGATVAGLTASAVEIMKKENTQLKKMLDKAKQIETLRRELLEKATKENELHKRKYQEQVELTEKLKKQHEEELKELHGTITALRDKATELAELEKLWEKSGKTPENVMNEIVPEALSSVPGRGSMLGDDLGGVRTRTRTFAITGTENDVSDLRLQLSEVKEKNEKLIKKIKYLQQGFDNTETLARALYNDLSVEAIDCPTRTGFLTKQGGSMKNWKHRFFVLKDNFLFYYKRPRDDAPLGVIHLDEYNVLQGGDEENRKHCFQIETKSRTWHMQADRQVEKDLWMLCISAAVPWYMRGEGEALTDASKSDKLLSSADAPPTKKKRPLSHAFRLSSYLTPSMAQLPLGSSSSSLSESGGGSGK